MVTQITSQVNRESTDYYSYRLNQIITRLKQLGLKGFELRRGEAKKLPQILHPQEEIGGAISGKSKHGHIMLVATDIRTVVLDCKPLFNYIEDITYDAIQGVSTANVGPFYTVTLHTRIGDFPLKTTRAKAVMVFKQFINQRRIENSMMRGAGI